MPRTFAPEAHYILSEPYYEPLGDEIVIFEAAYRNALPILLKGPTGCGKTRFMEYMAWRRGWMPIPRWKPVWPCSMPPMPCPTSGPFAIKAR